MRIVKAMVRSQLKTTGLAAVFAVAVALPSFAQTGETKISPETLRSLEKAIEKNKKKLAQ